DSEACSDAGVRLAMALTAQHHDKVFDGLLKHFPTGHVPSYYVMHSLAEIAKAHPLLLVPRLNDILGKVIPVLALIKKGSDQSVFTLCLGRFAKAILTFEEDADENQREQVNIIQFQTHCANAFDMVYTNWRKNTDNRFRLGIAEALGLLTEVMDPKAFAPKFSAVVDFFLISMKKEPPSNHYPLIS
ncbi:hypothetical protein RFI_19268, partial [Reticulomyxa filosa]